MLKLENTEVVGWEAAIRGMRNPKNSWDRSDSPYNQVLSKMCNECGKYEFDDETICDGCWVEEYEFPNHFPIGPNDHKLMEALANGGPVHAKYRRMIAVYVDITAPLYWWKEFDTYKVGTVANSCSTMHKIAAKEFTLEDFSCEHLQGPCIVNLEKTIKLLNYYRDLFNGTVEYDRRDGLDGEKIKKDWWWQMIQLLPSSYNQRRTVMLNYEVLANIYPMRKNHKLDEWHTFCDWIKTLPYSELITFEKEEAK